MNSINADLNEAQLASLRQSPLINDDLAPVGAGQIPPARAESFLTGGRRSDGVMGWWGGLMDHWINGLMKGSGGWRDGALNGYKRYVVTSPFPFKLGWGPVFLERR